MKKWRSGLRNVAFGRFRVDFPLKTAQNRAGGLKNGALAPDAGFLNARDQLCTVGGGQRTKLKS
jgi:hypothetical protein|eukprot:2112015-Prymnesium_polylepis.2